MSTAHASELERCAHVCHECQDICLRTIPHCLSRGDDHAAPGHIGLLMDCIAICAASHDLLHRESPLHAETCTACAAICDACADDCERIDGNDQRMKTCAETCRRCAASCLEMSGPAD